MNPLFDSPPPEVHLDCAPLHRVLCQVRFPQILSIGKPEFVADFQEAIRQEYPILATQQVPLLQLIGPGMEGVSPSIYIHTFRTEDGSWHLTLAPDFLSLQTTAYHDRAGFIQRLERVFEALQNQIKPSHSTRIGVRYIDRIEDKEGDDALQMVPVFFKSEILGLYSSPVFRGKTKQQLTQSHFEAKEGSLVARWGLLPANTTTDPSTIQPTPKDSWILDLDAFNESLVPFNSNQLTQQAKALSERIYTFFRWATEDAFLRHYQRVNPCS